MKSSTTGISKSTFDSIEIEYFERRLYEIVKASQEKQEEVDKSSHQVKLLKNKNKHKYLETECRKLQWRTMIQKHRTLQDFNFKFMIGE